MRSNRGQRNEVDAETPSQRTLCLVAALPVMAMNRKKNMFFCYF